jgi:NAD(P)-dependent dehydrogenase (short-subunit alcohol dehydrogenase family)
METGLKGKNALVTGAGTGIGRAIALALAKEGVNVAVASRNPPPDTLDEIREHGVDAVEIRTDVSEERQVVSMVDRAVDHFGHLDLFVNNAAGAWHEPVTKITSEAWRRTIDTNLSACVFACREVGRHMTARGQGAILIVGSTAQFNRGYFEVSYHISKTGLRVLMTSVALELAPYGIRANLLVPGHYPTLLTAGIDDAGERRLKGIIPARRFGRPEECANAAVFLLSDALSAYTTGAELVVDGGLHLRPIQNFSEDQIVEANAPTTR